MRQPTRVVKVQGVPPPPKHIPQPPPRDRLYADLAEMEINDCVDVNLPRWKAVKRIFYYRTRLAKDRELLFRTKILNDEWTRIWRTK